ncbi:MULTISPECIES: glycosyltransferase [spotted fever group]|uniref:UDP-D-galactose:(Glucosyl)lipopolysaccharide-1, 6-D-galactosyltransferase n=1 Tax=Rickettsia tamurae subsp. buchneri TaxID=1462938 RepID=A0A8E0WKB8_9RICK|nr:MULTISPECIES: glycosyltransferase [spotted fever group]EER20835.1 glycosyl transferase, group 1 family protein [Rickettsia endosymbiont of Ixodes scapularis]KDO02173.1 UDP-D-galactose:(glucosyl)lipopolysaccharide-1,6-D-galactosyltransferase [Rickettsia tamurae subsp. buchneri]
MKILKVIHGYPPYYRAGSEVYSQTLARKLSDNHEIQVFARHENSFLPSFHYSTVLDYGDPRILLHLINIPITKYRYKFINEEVNIRFEKIIDDFRPDLIHFGHLNHLSLNLPEIATKRGIPIVYTLHDFWLMCPRGRFIQRNSKELLQLCDGQEDKKCATECYKGYFTGDEGLLNAEITYWQQWVSTRMKQTKKIVEYVDHFVAPSKFLMNKFVKEFNIPHTKISYLDYGFDLNRLKDKNRIPEEDFIFGYIGTHTPEKGIDLLLKAFSSLSAKAKLRIWGALNQETAGLKAIANHFPQKVKDKIEWMGNYENENIVTEVFNKVDAIVVPSIWGENSPLVIHEAEQLRIPVITADYGGMAEYVQDGINGLLFKHRDIESLSEKMENLNIDKNLYTKLTKKGYLYSNDGNVPSISEHTMELEKIYFNIIANKKKSVSTKPGPWRITFDTNPDYCNYACIMCECFSPYSKVKENKRAEGIKPKIMPIATIRKVIQEAAGTPLREIIPSTMGEPLMYKHFNEIINICHEYGLKLNLTTNGSFPAKGAQKWAELLVPILSDIKISWNGASKEVNEKIMIGSKWEAVTKNLKTFLDVRDEYFSKTKKRCSVTLQLTFLESNLLELYDIVKMAIGLGIDRVKGHHLWAHFEEIKDLSMRRDETSINRWNTEVKRLYELRDAMLLPNGKKIILENFTILAKEGVEDLAPGGPCPFLGKEAWVNPEGKFSPCCAPDELRKTLGNFGNVNEVKLEDIWQSNQYKDLQKNYFNHELCKTCNMRKPLIS